MSCVNCGFCCRIAPCPYGEVTSPTDRACRFLVPEGRPGRWLCGKYDQIVDQPDADVVPAFGGGCCSSMFNEDRRRIIESERLATVAHGEPGP
jgi:hypothetical protein